MTGTSAWRSLTGVRDDIRVIFMIKCPNKFVIIHLVVVKYGKIKTHGIYRHIYSSYFQKLYPN